MNVAVTDLLSTQYTARLRIAPLEASHALVLHGPLQDPSIYTYIPEDPPLLDALKRRYAFLQNGQSPDGKEYWLNWVAFSRQSGEPVGTFQATLPEADEGTFAYVVLPTFWRQGYATEMAQHMLTHLFDTAGIETIAAEIDTRNSASIRLVERLGLQRVSTHTAADFFKGAQSDEHRYAVTRSAWVELHT